MEVANNLQMHSGDTSPREYRYGRIFENGGSDNPDAKGATSPRCISTTLSHSGSSESLSSLSSASSCSSLSSLSSHSDSPSSKKGETSSAPFFQAFRSSVESMESNSSTTSSQSSHRLPTTPPLPPFMSNMNYALSNPDGFHSRRSSVSSNVFEPSTAPKYPADRREVARAKLRDAMAAIQSPSRRANRVVHGKKRAELGVEINNQEPGLVPIEMDGNVQVVLSPTEGQKKSQLGRLSVIASASGWDIKLRELVLKEASSEPGDNSALARPITPRRTMRDAPSPLLIPSSQQASSTPLQSPNSANSGENTPQGTRYSRSSTLISPQAALWDLPTERYDRDSEGSPVVARRALRTSRSNSILSSLQRVCTEPEALPSLGEVKDENRKASTTSGEKVELPTAAETYTPNSPQRMRRRFSEYSTIANAFDERLREIVMEVAKPTLEDSPSPRRRASVRDPGRDYLDFVERWRDWKGEMPTAVRTVGKLTIPDLTPAPATPRRLRNVGKLQPSPIWPHFRLAPVGSADDENPTSSSSDQLEVTGHASTIPTTPTEKLSTPVMRRRFRDRAASLAVMPSTSRKYYETTAQGAPPTLVIKGHRLTGSSATSRSLESIPASPVKPQHGNILSEDVPRKTHSMVTRSDVLKNTASLDDETVKVSDSSKITSDPLTVNDDYKHPPSQDTPPSLPTKGKPGDDDLQQYNCDTKKLADTSRPSTNSRSPLSNLPGCQDPADFDDTAAETHVKTREIDRDSAVDFTPEQRLSIESTSST
ncbi:hypothetical protein DFS34DRAFT_595099 [Phlyctochytrium arcticum]|nr:hypothetical protein DFS34DRAFT_595099 [Phlyctochytrium arcticum]